MPSSIQMRGAIVAPLSRQSDTPEPPTRVMPHDTHLAAAAVGLTSAQLDALTAALTASSTFLAFTGKHGGPDGYRPTLRPDRDPRNATLADAYDVARQAQNDPRRAYRG